MTDHRTDFQSFVLNVYGIDGVSSASVLLQDSCGVDVNVVLLAAYVGAATGSSLTKDDVNAANARIQQWQQDVVAPLRAVRTRLKDGPSPAPNAATAALRERIKNIELDAEMLELGELADFAARLSAPVAPGGTKQRAEAAMRVVVGHRTARELDRDEDAAISVIASAAARFGRE